MACWLLSFILSGGDTVRTRGGNRSTQGRRRATTDSESILHLICQNGNSRGIEAGIRNAMSLMKGAYVLVLTLGDRLIGVRDPHGLHPLCLGRLGDGWVLASESCALDALDAAFVRDVEPGEIVIVDAGGPRSLEPSHWCRKSLCVFELVYFARPDSVVDGVSVYDFRRRSGALLAAQNPIEADMVMAVPDSGIPAGKRWSIEVFFKTCKSLLRLTRECQSISYDAMSAWVSVVFARSRAHV